MAVPAWRDSPGNAQQRFQSGIEADRGARPGLCKIGERCCDRRSAPETESSMSSTLPGSARDRDSGAPAPTGSFGDRSRSGASAGGPGDRTAGRDDLRRDGGTRPAATAHATMLAYRRRRDMGVGSHITALGRPSVLDGRMASVGGAGSPGRPRSRAARSSLPAISLPPPFCARSGSRTSMGSGKTIVDTATRTRPPAPAI